MLMKLTFGYLQINFQEFQNREQQRTAVTVYHCFIARPPIYVNKLLVPFAMLMLIREVTTVVRTL
jgi:hypothetical protein